jgi:hypothetical protein
MDRILMLSIIVVMITYARITFHSGSSALKTSLYGLCPSTASTTSCATYSHTREMGLGNVCPLLEQVRIDMLLYLSDQSYHLCAQMHIGYQI